MASFTEKGAPYPYEITKTAEKAVRSLPDRDIKRIAQGIEKACSSGTGDVAPLKDSSADYRLRIGEYRVIFDVLERKTKIKVIRNNRAVEEETTLSVVVIIDVLRRSGTTYSSSKR